MDDLTESVQFSIGLDTVISTEVSYGRDGEVFGHGPVTLGQMIAQIVADRLTKQVTSELMNEVRKPVRSRVDAIADQLVEEKLREVLTRETVPTDQYSTAKGGPTTLAEIITKRAEEWLAASSGDRSYREGRKTNLQRLIDEAVGRTFERELQAAVKQAKDAAVQAVADKAGEAMADILRKAAV